MGVLFCSTVVSEETKPLTMEQNYSYGVGFQIAQQIAQEINALKQRGSTIDNGIMMQAIMDVLSGAPLKVSPEAMKAAFDATREKQMAEFKVLAEKNQKASTEFLAKNKKVQGVTALPSGLQYKIISPGTGKSPVATDTVTVNYRGTLINGEEFDSSYKRGTPATFPVNGVIKGWQQALPLMKEGAKWQFFIPSDLAYGPQGNGGGGIGPNETLIFDVELIKVNEPTAKVGN